MGVGNCHDYKLDQPMIWVKALAFTNSARPSAISLLSSSSSKSSSDPHDALETDFKRVDTRSLYNLETSDRECDISSVKRSISHSSCYSY